MVGPKKMKLNRIFFCRLALYMEGVYMRFIEKLLLLTHMLNNISMGQQFGKKLYLLDENLGYIFHIIKYILLFHLMWSVTT